ncbi:hypothetical protein PU629_13455 [Pullulanibacillus sp. KACC 23026]|uniref:hypothetical protein n=1 Tax=Pullulanibacillus sp. KACC 23026 TaxID=3028315 RepID=UPI0023B0F053|nr:hypothetical protein [Pullulanibacillus sp. KACC 23026]WEG11173.1 hypothetical protein PU629_13455 [Pullulanibacillus sp. KACC 23026]
MPNRNAPHNLTDLLHNPINGITHEEAVLYFTRIRKPFQNLRQIIHRLSGFMILFHNQKFLKSEAVLAFELGKDLLGETMEDLRTIKVPPIAERHFHQLFHSANYLYEFYQIKRDQPTGTESHDYGLSLLEKAYSSLKKATDFSNGLEMVSLDSSCACGHH